MASPGARFGREGGAGKGRALAEQEGPVRGVVSAPGSTPEGLALGQVSTALEEGSPSQFTGKATDSESSCQLPVTT